jgi:hypothetical protein
MEHNNMREAGYGNNWTFVLDNPKYSTFEDPFSGMPVPKAEFNATYGPACEEVFQCGITVELLFNANPVTCGEWRFADDDARDDLYDAAVEMGLVASSKEVCAGETAEEKACRNAFEAAMEAQKRAQQEHGGERKVSGLEVRGGILSRGRAGPPDVDADDDVVFEDPHCAGSVASCSPEPPSRERKAEERATKTGEELQAELERVLAEFELSGLSNKRRKKLERRQRGIMAALEKSDEGIA